MTSLFDAARDIRWPKQGDPEKLRVAARKLLELRRAWFEDAMREKDERMMTIHADWMDRLERLLKT